MLDSPVSETEVIFEGVSPLLGMAGVYKVQQEDSGRKYELTNVSTVF